ncbi:MAG: hypothetical protein WCI65_12105 [Synechococcaceae cyanobacterium ELA263]
MSTSTSGKAATVRIGAAKAALLAASMAVVAFTASSVQACEKHLNGHQNGSDTHQEVQSGSQQH